MTIEVKYYKDKEERKLIINSLLNSRVLHDDFLDEQQRPTNGESGKLTIVSGLDDPSNIPIIPPPKRMLTQAQLLQELASERGIELS